MTANFTLGVYYLVVKSVCLDAFVAFFCFVCVCVISLHCVRPATLGGCLTSNESFIGGTSAPLVAVKQCEPRGKCELLPHNIV